MTIDEILSLFEGVKQNGVNHWMAQCPAHMDEKPSLSITLDGDRMLGLL